MDKIEFISWDKTITEIPKDNIFYCLPESGIIKIRTDEESISKDNYVIAVPDKEIPIEVRKENILIRIKDSLYNIHVLTAELDDAIKDEYIKFSNTLIKGLHNKVITQKELWDLFEKEEKEDRLIICEYASVLKNATENTDIDVILKLVPSLPPIFHKPKQHLKQIEEVKPAATVTRIGQDSIKHLASHSEHWKAVKANGLVPERLLAKALEDDFEIYENKAVKKLVDTLLQKETKEKVLTVELLNQLEELDSTFSHEDFNKNLYEAQKILWNGILPDQISEKNNIIKNNKIKLTSIINYLISCKNSKTYRKLKNTKFYSTKLNKTNIFMMDKNYKKAYLLWNLIFRENSFNKENIQISLCEQYTDYVKILLQFTLRYSGFVSKNDLAIAYSENLKKQEFEKDDIELCIDYDRISDTPAIHLTFRKKSVYKILINDLNCKLPESFSSYVIERNGYLITNKLFSDSERKRFIQEVSQQWDKKEKIKNEMELRRRLFEAFSITPGKIKTITLIPWKFKLPDNEIEFKMFFDHLPAMYKKNEFYLLSSNRPTDFESIKNKSLLQRLINYGSAYEEYNIQCSSAGHLPINIYDMNSYRRIAKLIIKQEIEIESDYCPICSQKFLTGLNKKECPQCGFAIRETKCANCEETFKYTEYKLPKVNILDDIVTPGTEVIIDEIHLGFKNITNAKIIDNRIHPICPLCGKF